MKRTIAKRLGFRTPPDGYTEEEKILQDLICERVVDELYGKMPTSRMKAILAMHFELGYDQETLGKVFGVTQEQVALDIANIRKLLLGKPYKPHKRKQSIKKEDLIKMMISLAEL